MSNLAPILPEQVDEVSTGESAVGSPFPSDPTSDPKLPRAMTVDARFINAGMRSPTANEERLLARQRTTLTGSIAPPSLKNITKTCLPRGGSYLSTVIGPIQVGIPPETIKDSMAMGLSVPQYFVLPPESFCRTLGNSLGVNVAEFEFPAYYNFFLKSRPVKLVVASEDAEKRIRALMQETLLGPASIDVDVDFASSVKAEDRPNLVKELSYFRVYNGKELSIDSLISFVHLDRRGVVTLEGEDGTPGAGFRLTIAASDSNGGEYVVTEFEPGLDDVVDGLDDGGVDGERGETISDATVDGSPYTIGDRDSAGEGENWDDPEMSPRHTMFAKSSVSTGHLLGRPSIDEIMEDQRKAKKLERHTEADTDGHESVVDELKSARRQHIEQAYERKSSTAAGPRRLKGPSLLRLVEEVGQRDENTRSSLVPSHPHRRRSSVDGDCTGGPASLGSVPLTPTPPHTESPSSTRSPRFGGGVLVLKRLARSVVRNAGLAGVRGKPEGVSRGGDLISSGENRGKGGQLSTATLPSPGETETRAAGTMSAAYPGEEQSVPPAAETVGEGGNSDRKNPANLSPKGEGYGATRAKSGRLPTKGTSVRGSAGASIKGFRPVRQAVVPMTCPLPSLPPFHPVQTEKEFTAPNFGATVLGNSHGFDPKGSTTGYVLWISGRGYMIDPPPYASMILQSFNIRPSLIAGVIVTHCHADHDAGTFQKVLFDGQVNIISTRTIYESFIRKYSALSGMNAGLIRQSHKFTPVFIGQTLRLHGASFDFFYTLHSIPCIGFEVTFRGKGMVFSADHMNDPERVRAMCEEGFITVGRRDALLNFPWHHDVIFHEAGIPPIHTPMRTLEDLPDEVKARLYVVHVSPSSIPEGKGLRVAPAGVEHTIRLDTPGSAYGEAIEVLDLIGSMGMLTNLSVWQARSLLEVGRITRYPAGTVLQRQYAEVVHFAVICHGKAVATVAKEAGKRQSYAVKQTTLRRGDCYGEELLLAGSVRREGYVHVKAVSDVEARNLAAGEIVWEASQPVELVVLVAKGKLAFRLQGERPLMSGSYVREGRRMEAGERQRRVICPEYFLPGSLIGRAGTLLDPPSSNHYRYTLEAMVDSVVLAISREDMTTFSYANPGVFMCIHDLQFVC